MVQKLRERISKQWAALGVILAAVAGCATLSLHLYESLTKPDINDWALLTGELKTGFVKGEDAVAVEPFWAERSLEFFGDLEPLLVHDLANWDFDSTKRLHLIFAFEPDETLRTKLANTFSFKQTKKFGKLTYDLFEKRTEPAKVVFNFFDQFPVSRGIVKDIRTTAETPCRKMQKELRCGDQEWKKFEPKWMDVGNDPHKCIWAHPQNGKVISLLYDNVPHGEKLTLYAGLTGHAVRMGGEPVNIEVKIDNAQTKRFEIPNEEKWFRFDVEVPGTTTDLHTVGFSVYSRNDGMRHFCFDALLRNYSKP